jgi:hypothetical protein
MTVWPLLPSTCSRYPSRRLESDSGRAITTGASRRGLGDILQHEVIRRFPGGHAVRVRFGPSERNGASNKAGCEREKRRVRCENAGLPAATPMVRLASQAHRRKTENPRWRQHRRKLLRKRAKNARTAPDGRGLSRELLGTAGS